MIDGEPDPIDSRFLGNFPKEAFAVIEHHLISFDFKDLGFEGSAFCFNNEQISSYDYRFIFGFLKDLSGCTVHEVFQAAKFKSTYDIKLLKINQKSNPKIVGQICKLLQIDPKNYDPLKAPSVFQASLYNSDRCIVDKTIPNTKSKAPRLYFIAGNKGCQAMIMLDLYHELFPTEDRSSR